MDKKVLIVVCTAGGLHEVTAAAVAAMARQKGVDLFIAKGCPHDYARNQACRYFLSAPEVAEHTHLMFVDSDTEPPQDAVARLLAHEAPVVTGCCPLAMPGGLRWALCDKDPQGLYHCLPRLKSHKRLFHVDACGAGCLMIRRDVLAAMDWPWFKWVETPDGRQRGEDVYFGAKCGEHNIPILADPSVQCRHFKTLDLLGLMQARESFTEESDE